MKNNLLFTLCLVLLFSCKNNDNDPAPVAIFSLTTDPGYAMKENWVMIYDKNGTLLDYKQFTTGDIVTFQWSKSIVENKISVTLFSLDSINNYVINSYLAIPVGQEWRLKSNAIKYAQGAGETIGTLNVTYTPPSPVRMDVLGNTFTFGSHHLVGSAKVCTLPIFEKSKNYLLSVAGDGNPRYKFFENVKDRDSYQVSFESMTEYDNILDISFPSANNPYARVQAYDNDGIGYYLYYNGFNLPPFAPSSTVSNLKIGYLNRFTKYDTYISILLKDFGFTYIKIGSVPASFTVPSSAPYKLIDKSFTNFSYSKETPFSVRRTGFRPLTTIANTYIGWTIIAPDVDHKCGALAPALLDKYPFLAIDNFVSSSTIFEASTESYLDYINNTFGGSASNGEKETTAFTIR